MITHHHLLGRKFKYENRFGSYFQRIPFDTSDTMKERFLQTLRNVKKGTDTTREDYELMVNNFLAEILVLFPRSIMRMTTINLAQNTLIFSIVPGPVERFTINGFELEDISVFLQNSHGVPVSLCALSFGDKLCLSLFADEV